MSAFNSVLIYLFFFFFFFFWCRYDTSSPTQSPVPLPCTHIRAPPLGSMPVISGLCLSVELNALSFYFYGGLSPVGKHFVLMMTSKIFFIFFITNQDAPMWKR
jgi:hypothetical protein